MSRTLWRCGRVVGPPLTLAVLVWRVGTGPFVEGLRTVDAGVAAAAAGIGVVTTVCCAWRWTLVAGGLGLELSMPAAVAAYYRSLFLNVALPGGIVGDVHRAVSHGRDVGDLGRAVRSVAWERFAGQVVQALVTLVALLALPSPVQSAMPWVAAAGLAAVLGLAAAVWLGPRRPSAWARVRTAALADVRAMRLGRRAWLAVAVASTVVVAGHALTFLIAARSAGAIAPPSHILPIALLAMIAMVLPSVGGWGPREGVTAWAFAAAGLGAQRGIATAVVYGVVVLVASLPGAAVLAVACIRGARHPRSTEPVLVQQAAHA